MLDRMHKSATAETGKGGWNSQLPVGQTRFDVSTGSALSAPSPIYAIAQLDIVVDLMGNKITLLSPRGLPGLQFMDFGHLQPAVEAARDYLTGERKVWEIFSVDGGEARLIGGFETPDQGQDAVKDSTDLVSQVPLRTNVVPVDKSIRGSFTRLASDWKRTRDKYSSGIEMFVHPAYQQVIGMGTSVLPLIFEELNRELDHWFWALKAITQADPVPPEDVGNLAVMRDRWLTWAAEHDLWQPNYTSTHSEAGNSLR